MPPTSPFVRRSMLSRLSGRHRIVLAAVVALLLVVTLATLLPRGDDAGDGALTPSTQEKYVARTTAPGPSRVTAAEKAEIARVLDAAPRRIGARVSPARQATGLLRCAEFEQQQYCLGVGWTEADSDDLASRVATSASAAARGRAVESTGDLSTADLLARRAAMSPRQRRAAERAELEDAVRGVAKVVLLRHQLLGEPLPDGFLARHPEARATAGQETTTRTTARRKRYRDYPRKSRVLNPNHVREQHRTYWCGPTTMQMIGWGWKNRLTQRRWARRLGTTSSGTAITQMVRTVNRYTGFDRESYAGRYIVLDISDWNFRAWRLLQMRHIKDYRAPVVLHPVLEKRFYPYLDDDASGHFQVGRGYRKRGGKPDALGYFEPWNQQRFDPSEPYISRVQWRRAYNSYRANRAHFQHNIGV